MTYTKYEKRSILYATYIFHLMETTSSHQSQKILVVEDEVALRRLLVEQLTEAGYDVFEADDGGKGVASALEHHPHLILLDIIMPEMDGITAMKKIREDAWGKSVPIILLTNVGADEKMLRQVMEHEPAYYLVKSDWKIEDILKKIREVLNS